MRIISLERKKTIFIMILVLLSILQMGILWTEKNPGVPFLFSTQKLWYSVDLPDIDDVKGKYLQPEKIIVSDGSGILYWSINTTDNYYGSIWADLNKSYFRQILEQKPTEGTKSYEQDWHSLIKMKSIIVEFKSPVSTEIISWVTNYKSIFTMPLKQIYKIAIFPTESINNNENTLYVYDGETVYKYVVKTEQGNMKKDEYVGIINNIHKNEASIPLNKLAYSYPSVKNQELIVSLDVKSERKIWDLLVKTPDEIILNRDNLDNIENYLLGDIYRGSMVTTFKDDSTSIICSDTEQVLRYYRNGFLDYQYRNRSLGEKGRVSDAFEKALTFIEHRRNLIEGVDIVLSSVEQEDKDENYIFTFDYIIDGMEVKIMSEQDEAVKPAITIVANSDRVVDVKWYIKTFSNNDYYNYYSLYFFDIFDNKMINDYPQPLHNFNIYDISIDYICPESSMRAEPYWFIDTGSQVLYLRMQGKEG